MAFTIVTVAEMQFMAGENRDATGDVTANHQFLHDYAAGWISHILNYDVIGKFGDLTANVKFMITEWAARLAGSQIILFNPAGYSSLLEAEDMVTLHTWRMDKIEAELKKPGALKALGGAR